MQTLLKDLLLGIFLVCLTLAFTTLVQAAMVAPAGIESSGQPSESPIAHLPVTGTSLATTKSTQQELRQ
ncbi:MAG: hypothetical protein WBN81_01470 [Gammaproteobacteria bacterium]